MRRRWQFRVVGAAMVVAATGCSTNPPIAKAVVSHAPGVPTGLTPLPSAGDINTVAAGWATADEVYVVTWGSGSCPNLPTSVHADQPQHVVITTKERVPKGDYACTADLGPTTSTVRLPSATKSTVALTVTIDGTSIDLPPRN